MNSNMFREHEAKNSNHSHVIRVFFSVCFLLPSEISTQLIPSFQLKWFGRQISQFSDIVSNKKRALFFYFLPLLCYLVPLILPWYHFKWFHWYNHRNEEISSQRRLFRCERYKAEWTKNEFKGVSVYCLCFFQQDQ